MTFMPVLLPDMQGNGMGRFVAFKIALSFNNIIKILSSNE
jgi:hypothetical protein